jgi:hypothetical protein
MIILIYLKEISYSDGIKTNMTQNCMQQWATVIAPFNQWILLTEMYASLKQAREQYKH